MASEARSTATGRVSLWISNIEAPEVAVDAPMQEYCQIFVDPCIRGKSWQRGCTRFVSVAEPPTTIGISFLAAFARYCAVPEVRSIAGLEFRGGDQVFQSTVALENAS